MQRKRGLNQTLPRNAMKTQCNASLRFPLKTAMKGEGGGGAAGEKDAAARARVGADADQPRHGLAQPRGEGEGTPERMSWLSQLCRSVRSNQTLSFKFMFPYFAF